LNIKDWQPMQEINRRPPDSMTVSERMDEVTALLARGVSRVWDQSVAKSANAASKSHLGLGYSGHQSVHTDPSTKVTESK
jgi:hypothetical protein